MPRQLEAAERLAVDQRAGDLAVDVQVADAELAACTVSMLPGCASRTPPVRAYCVPLAISSASSRSRRLDHRQHRAEDLLLGDGRVGGTSAKMCGAT